MNQRWPRESIVFDSARQLRLANEQNGNAVAHRVDAAAAGALQGAFISGQRQRFAALRDRAGKDVQELLERRHPSDFKHKQAAGE